MSNKLKFNIHKLNIHDQDLVQVQKKDCNALYTNDLYKKRSIKVQLNQIRNLLQWKRNLKKQNINGELIAKFLKKMSEKFY